MVLETAGSNSAHPYDHLSRSAMIYGGVDSGCGKEEVDPFSFIKTCMPTVMTQKFDDNATGLRSLREDAMHIRIR